MGWDPPNPIRKFGSITVLFGPGDPNFDLVVYFNPITLIWPPIGLRCFNLALKPQFGPVDPSSVSWPYSGPDASIYIWSPNLALTTQFALVS